MKESKQVSARIGTQFIEEYLEEYKKYQEMYFPHLPVNDLTMTRILEESLFYGKLFFKEATKEK